MSKIVATQSGKQLVFAKVLRIIGLLDDAHGLLDDLFDSFNLDDVRQDDFVSDAEIEEHLYSLIEIMTKLGASVKQGGLLDEHFDRELAE
jgi:hypothetical protein